MDARPHLFCNLPLPPHLLHCYLIILLSDRHMGVNNLPTNKLYSAITYKVITSEALFNVDSYLCILFY